MTKTTALTEDTHKRLKDMQSVLRDRYNMTMNLQDIVARIIPGREEAIKMIIDSIKRVSNTSDDVVTDDVKLGEHNMENSSKHNSITLLEDTDVRT